MIFHLAGSLGVLNGWFLQSAPKTPSLKDSLQHPFGGSPLTTGHIKQRYLGDHPSGCKWLGSPPFISHKQAHLEGVPQPDPYGTNTITMVIKHVSVRPGVILQVDARKFFTHQNSAARNQDSKPRTGDAIMHFIFFGLSNHFFFGSYEVQAIKYPSLKQVHSPWN